MPLMPRPHGLNGRSVKGEKIMTIHTLINKLDELVRHTDIMFTLAHRKELEIAIDLWQKRIVEVKQIIDKEKEKIS